MEKTCPKVEKCPIFINNVLVLETAKVAYKSLYCEAGQQKYSSCKRFIIANMIGSCPPSVMPNSSRTVEEIITKIA